MKKIALVTGSSGQDGSYLCELLLKKNYRSYSWREDHLETTNGDTDFRIENKLIYEYFDLTDFNSILRVLKNITLMKYIT